MKYEDAVKSRISKKMNKDNGRQRWTSGCSWLQRAMLMVAADVLIVLGSYFLALVLRFEFSIESIPDYYLTAYCWSMPYWITATVVVSYIYRLYHSIWEMAGVAELERLLFAYLTLLPVYGAGGWFMGLHMPRSYYFMGYIVSFCLASGIRFISRVAGFYRSSTGVRGAERKRTMVIGAGHSGQALIKELHGSAQSDLRVCCIIDDDMSKCGCFIEGVPVVGNRHAILFAAQRYQICHIVYAISSAEPKERRDILNICKDTGCRVQVVPSVASLAKGDIKISTLRDVELTDLLGRKTVKVNNEEILADLSGRCVLVTGGGGSIGSELCRQIAGAGPRELIIFDIYENNAYEIQQELRRRYPQLSLTVLIGSVRNEARVRSIMEQHRPDIVFHAAAHKHVPLMEDSPNEAIKNNVLGTFKTAQAAAMAGVRKFVLISTDKAVNPTNIMGASKRLCEMVVQMMGRRHPATTFVAVRFGNVIGSNGSVIPLFRRQIAEGGPVTVTDKNIIRYFMTIPEAVSLVLQASYYATSGEIFVLDMGDPVRIDDVARNLIRLSGLTPDVDIAITYTGLRPGEKLYEELLMDEEGLRSTANELIHIGRPIQMDDDSFCERLSALADACEAESEDIRRLVSELVPTYRPA